VLMNDALTRQCFASEDIDCIHARFHCMIIFTIVTYGARDQFLRFNLAVTADSVTGPTTRCFGDEFLATHYPSILLILTSSAL